MISLAPIKHDNRAEVDVMTSTVPLAVQASSHWSISLAHAVLLNQSAEPLHPTPTVTTSAVSRYARL